MAGGGIRERADTLRNAVREANRTGRPARAAALAATALALLDQLEPGPGEQDDIAQERALLLISLAFAEFEVHGWDRGRLALDRAAVAAQASGSPYAVALVHDLSGIVWHRMRDYDRSLEEFDQAVALATHYPPEERLVPYVNRSVTHTARGDLPSARSDLRRAVDLAQTVGVAAAQGRALHNLAHVEYLAGNLPLALDLLAQAQALDDSLRTRQGLLDRARILMEAGLLDDAQETLESARRALGRAHANHERAEVDLALAECALLRDDLATASRHAGRAARSFRQRQAYAWLRRADLARWEASLERPRGARQVARELERLSEAATSGTSALEDEVVLLAAEAHLQLGQVELAKARLVDIRAPRRGEVLTTRLRQHYVRAGVARASEDRATARREIRVGLGVLSKQQARQSSIDVRSAIAVHGGRLAALDLRIALESGSAATVFDTLERWRAMSHRRTAVTPPSDPVLAELVSRLRVVAEELRTATPGPETAVLERRRATLERAVREREWQLPGAGKAERPLRLTSLRPLLAERATDAVSYFVLEGRLGAVSIVAGRAEVHALGPWAAVDALVMRIRADLDAMSGPFVPAALRGAISASLTRDLATLDRLLLPSRLDDSEAVFVVPSRTLGTAPWGLLARRVGRPTTVALSSTAWARGLMPPVRRPLVAAVAGPGLHYAQAEVRDVAQRWRTGEPVEAGTAEMLVKALSTHDVVHIAAHGTHNHQNPLFSSLRMADGPLFAYDIPQDEALAGHVVLSACELGLATPRPGGEVLGLTAALLGLGTRSVVSSVSRVGDDTAYETMLRYHKHLAAGVDSPTALARAVADDLASPAAFVCFGSPWAAQPLPQM